MSTPPTNQTSGLVGPIAPGDRYEWNWNHAPGWALVEVIRVQETQNDERRIWTRTINGVGGNRSGEETWNDESRFREACIRLKADGSRDYTSWMESTK